MGKEYFVYILRSERDGRRYIGYTADLERRLSEHQSGLVKSTKFRRPLKLVHTEKYSDKKEAEKREMFFKTGQGRQYLSDHGL
jgi:putative endonuclease